MLPLDSGQCADYYTGEERAMAELGLLMELVQQVVVGQRELRTELYEFRKDFYEFRKEVNTRFESIEEHLDRIDGRLDAQWNEIHDVKMQTGALAQYMSAMDRRLIRLEERG